MTLPQEFQKKMQKLLGEEYGQFLESYQREPLQALRVNTLKMPVEEYQQSEGAMQ